MSLSAEFSSRSVASSQKRRKRNRPAPFSLRLSADERTRLEAEAKGAPLGSYIKAKVLGSALPISVRRTGLAIEDKTSLARALALLGRSRLSSNLNQLAHAVNIGVLPVTPETEKELAAAAADVRSIRHLLMTALGLKPEAEP